MGAWVYAYVRACVCVISVYAREYERVCVCVCVCEKNLKTQSTFPRPINSPEPLSVDVKLRQRSSGDG